MTTHARLRWGAVGLVVLAIALISGSHLCGVAFDKAASDPGMRPISVGALACTEFWLNRYQTLLGACVAVFAAFYAGLLVKEQIKKSEDQIRLLRSQIAITMIPSHRGKIRKLVEIIEAFTHFDRGYRDSIFTFKSLISTIEYPDGNASIDFGSASVLDVCIDRLERCAQDMLSTYNYITQYSTDFEIGISFNEAINQQIASMDSIIKQQRNFLGILKSARNIIAKSSDKFDLDILKRSGMAEQFYNNSYSFGFVFAREALDNEQIEFDRLDIVARDF